jgi:uncharacterized membrane protein YcaP (DUF421 family)
VRTFDLARLWTPELNPLEVVLRATLAYLSVHVVFRVAGRKAFQRWGAPEIVLLFLVSTAMRKSIVVDDESVTTAVIALVTLAALDRLVTTITARWRKAADVVEGPVLQLVRDGAIDRAAMRRARLGEHELLSRVRAKGHTRLDEIRDAFFERSGEVTMTFRSS